MANTSAAPIVGTATAAKHDGSTPSAPGPSDGAITKRLQQELMQLMMSGDDSVSAFPEGDNLFHWIGTIAGSKDSVYDGLSYKLSLKFPSGAGGACYPYAPPVVKFETACFHPNVDQHGNICLDILKDKWSACYNIRTILLSIQSMLGDPNNESPLNGYAAALWDNQTEFRSTLLRKYEEDQKDGGSA
eukprot:TRINITY_DN3083_c0_g1_i2.p1 TRINITY_DN3083_c0_g1~~TRINITY_DN3083_c0_g1_i2.p1  ORF type:complete len:188 (-),score=35.77 TRINITY_DN3083_c0_g1_i2:284-847(-)